MSVSLSGNSIFPCLTGQNLQLPADLVTITEDIPNGKLSFLEEVISTGNSQ